jgi:predicted  nucleic acid-binding Zn-ribbon protein
MEETTIIIPGSETPAVETEQIDDTLDDVSEQLLELVEQSQSQNAQLKEGIEKCSTTLDILLNRTETTTEQPALNQLLTEVQALRTEVGSLKSSLERPMNLQPIPSDPLTVETLPSEEVENPVVEIENPVIPQTRKARFT